MIANTVNNSNVERWVESGMDEVRRLAAPVPPLLFSPPVSDNFWLTVAELHLLQGRLSFNGRLADLSGLPGVFDPIFYELLTTEGLLIIITERPFTPPQPQGAVWFRRHPNRHYNPPDESFWIKNLPVPSTLRPTAFTLELLQEDGQLHWNTIRRFCCCY